MVSCSSIRQKQLNRIEMKFRINAAHIIYCLYSQKPIQINYSYKIPAVTVTSCQRCLISFLKTVLQSPLDAQDTKMYTWRTFLNLMHTLSNSVVEVVVGVFEIKKLNSDTKIFVHYTFSLKNIKYSELPNKCLTCA